MKIKEMVGIILLAGSAFGLAGCCGGGETTVKEQPIIISPSSNTTGTTVGQELESLDEAYKKGVITKEQYEAAKKKILEKAGK